MTPKKKPRGLTEKQDRKKIDAVSSIDAQVSWERDKKKMV